MQAQNLLQKYGLVSIAVIDDDGKIIGVVSIDDVVGVIEEEVEEDIMRLSGIAESDFYSSTVETASHRFPWLLFNLLTAIAASAVIAIFENEIQDSYSDFKTIPDFIKWKPEINLKLGLNKTLNK